MKPNKPAYRLGPRGGSYRAAAVALSALAAGSVLWPTSAQAAGFWNLDRGASNYGRGGANIADPDDPIAVYTNPAALAGLRGLQLHIDANTVLDTRTFARSPDGMGRNPNLTYTYEVVSNGETPWPPSPGIFASYNFASLDLEGLTIALGVYGPPRSDSETEDTRPPRLPGSGRRSGIASATLREASIPPTSVSVKSESRPPGSSDIEATK